jgi:preprotein translocase subunit SecD
MTLMRNATVLCILVVLLLLVFSVIPLTGCSSSREPGWNFILEADQGASSPADLDAAAKAITNRLKQAGVRDVSVSIHGNDEIHVRVPEKADRDDIHSLLTTRGFLELRLVRDELNPEQVSKTGLPADCEAHKLRGQADGERQIVLLKKSIVTSSHIKSAEAVAKAGDTAVSIVFNKEGAATLGQVSRENVGRQMAILLDGKVFSTPVIKEPLSERIMIGGSFTPGEAKDLAALFAGTLPMPLQVIASLSDAEYQEHLKRVKEGAAIDRKKD